MGYESLEKAPGHGVLSESGVPALSVQQHGNKQS